MKRKEIKTIYDVHQYLLERLIDKKIGVTLKLLWINEAHQVELSWLESTLKDYKHFPWIIIYNFDFRDNSEALSEKLDFIEKHILK